MRNDKIFKRRRLSGKKSKKGELSSPSQRGYSLDDFLSTVGNQGIANFFESGLLQAKLNVSQPGDIYEQEADRIAKIVVNTNTVQTPKAIRLQAKSDAENLSVNSRAESEIKSLKGKGNPLSKPLRDYFEPRFGIDLGNIKVHTDSNANLLANSIHAKAFTYDKNVVFGKGQYQPETASGKELIAHELTHTVQQGAAVQRVEQVFDDSTQSFHTAYTPEEYAQQVMRAIDDCGPGYDQPNKARKGFEIIINLPIETIFQVIKIISSEYSAYYTILKYAAMYTLFDSRKMDIIVACFNSLYKNNSNDVDILKFRNDTVDETVDMLCNTVWAIDREINTYENDDTKLTELAQYIKYPYQNRYNEADLLRADTLVSFCYWEDFENEIDIRGTNNLQYIPKPGILFAAVEAAKSHNDGCIENFALTLKKYDTNTIFDTMASFMYLYKKDKIGHAGADYNTNGAMYNKDAKNYIMNHYSNIVKAENQDIVTTGNLRTKRVAEFGFLADIHTDFRTLSRKSVTEIREYVKITLHERKKNAQETIQRLDKDPELIWELKPAIYLNMEKQGISEDTEKGKLISDRVQARDNFKLFRSIALGAIGFALGIAGYFTAGSAWAAIPIVLGLGVSALDLVTETDDYSFHSAASKSMYELALAVEPNALGIAFAILDLALNVVDVMKLGNTLLKEVSERLARTSFENLDQAIEAEYRLLKENTVYNSADTFVNGVSLDEFAEAVLKNRIPLGFENAKQFAALNHIDDGLRFVSKTDEMADGIKAASNYADGAAGASNNWKFGEFKSTTKWQNQMTKRGWTPDQITEAIKSGKTFKMVNKVNPGNQALRYVHPTTGKSVVIDAVTNEILQIGGEGFVW